jgi:ParB family chromosome partitioning protein
MLGREAIPCIVSSATDEMEIYLEQIAENLTREGFSPIEEAEAFHKLLNDERFRSSTKFLSAKLGKPESYIKNKMELLKFSNAVKKLIVSGTEIRKDQLTEDQLIPLKDLPMEHRDPLALIAARDEMAVSDVKKIAKLFKDKTISDNTKEKLLLKNGDGLIETWSVYEQNRKERAKAQKEQEETAARKAELAAEARASGAISPAASNNAAGDGVAVHANGMTVSGNGMAVSDGGRSDNTPIVSASNAGGAANNVSGGTAWSGGTSSGESVMPPAYGAPAQQTRSSVSALMRQLQEMLPRQNELSSTIYRLAASLQEEAEALSAAEIDHTIGMLQQQLAQWQELRAKLSN